MERPPPPTNNATNAYEALSSMPLPPSELDPRPGEQSLFTLLALYHDAAMDDATVIAAPVYQGKLTKSEYADRCLLWASLDGGWVCTAAMDRRQIAQLLLRMTRWLPPTLEGIDSFLRNTPANTPTSLLREVADVLHYARGFRAISFDTLQRVLLRWRVPASVIIALGRGQPSRLPAEPRSRYYRALLFAAALTDMWFWVDGDDAIRVLEHIVLGTCRALAVAADFAKVLDSRSPSAFLDLSDYVAPGVCGPDPKLAAAAAAVAR
jgi:hypothetical protein